MKIAIVVGHTDSNEGAHMVAPFDYVSEYEYNTMLAAMTHHFLNHKGVKCRVFFRDFKGVEACYQNVYSWKPDCAVELHFNSSRSKQANGLEVLYGPQRGAQVFAQEMLQWIHSALQLKSRGIRELSRNDRGGFNVSRLTAPQLLVEPFFGSNESDCEAALVGMTDLAQAIADGCISYLAPKAITESLQ